MLGCRYFCRLSRRQQFHEPGRGREWPLQSPSSPSWFSGQASWHRCATPSSLQFSLSALRLCILEMAALNPVSPSIGSGRQKVKTSACPVYQHVPIYDTVKFSLRSRKKPIQLEHNMQMDEKNAAVLCNGMKEGEGRANQRRERNI